MYKLIFYLSSFDSSFDYPSRKELLSSNLSFSINVVYNFDLSSNEFKSNYLGSIFILSSKLMNNKLYYYSGADLTYSIGIFN